MVGTRQSSLNAEKVIGIQYTILSKPPGAAVKSIGSAFQSHVHNRAAREITAIALAAQNTLADLFGGLSIIMRGAVRVGDFCQIDKVLGTVEDIGISSLSLRTLERSLVSIPNSKVAEVNLENFSFRDQFWVNQVFTLRFDTSHKVLKTVLDNIFQILKDYPEIDKESARARLINLTPTGPQIEIFAYIRRPGMDRAAFLAAQEPLLLKILSAIDTAGASIAAPVQVVKMDAPQSPPDPGATR